MKIWIQRLPAVLVFFLTAGLQIPAVLAQGSLTPPGAPAPMMKSLAQIEPRIPISSAPLTITNAGSYYLTTNITVSSGNAITINSNNVTLDLMGFTISSTDPGNTGSAILLNSGPGGIVLQNITILNGFIRGAVTGIGSGVYSGSGFSYGIARGFGFAPENVRITGISISGCASYGIYLNSGGSTVVESCTVRTVGYAGINAAIVKNSSAEDCGSYAIIATQVSDCLGETSGNNTTAISAQTAQNCTCSGGGIGLSTTTANNCVCYFCGTGIITTSGGTLTGCSATSCFNTGINAGSYSILENCAAYGNFTNGIVAGQGCTVRHCTASVNGLSSGFTNGVGIISDIRSTIEGCTVNDNYNDGIIASGDSAILDNHASHNGLGYGSAAGIHTVGSGSRIEGNHTRDNSGYGIKSDAGPNGDIIIRNTSGGNGIAAYTPTSGNNFAPVQTPATMTNPLANIAF